jgi:hypothetical protein
MRVRSTFRPSFEHLEDRSVPAIAASVTNSVLTVSGTATNPFGLIEVQVTGTNASNNAFQVFDSGSPVGGTFTAKNVRILLTSDNDNVLLDLNAMTMKGNAYVNLGNGDDTFVVQNGTVNDGLAVYGGFGKDDLTIDNVTIANSRNTYLSGDGGIDDTLTITNNSNLTGNAYAYAVNTITVDPGSKIGGSFFIFAGTGPNDVTINGNVGNYAAGTGDVLFYSNFFVSYDVQQLTVNGQVGRDVRFTSSINTNFGNQVTLGASADVKRDVSIAGTTNNDTVTVANGAKIGRDFSLFLGAGDDTVNVGNATIGRTTYMYLGAGDNNVNFTATTGSGSGLAFYVDAGTGANTLTVEVTTAKIKGTGTVRFAAGNDSFTRIGAGNTAFTFTIFGRQPGTNTFIGSVDNLVLVNFP